MSVVKTINSTSLSIEVENGTNSSNEVVYKKFNFHGLRTDSSIEDIYAVATAIKNLLANNTKDCLITEVSKIEEV